MTAFKPEGEGKKGKVKDVQPIRDYDQITDMKWALKRFCGERDYILFLLGINTGLKVSVLLNLKIKDLKKKKKVTVKEGRTKKPRIIHLNNIYHEIDSYIETLENTEWLFPSRKGDKPISRIQAYRQYFKRGERMREKQPNINIGATILFLLFIIAFVILFVRFLSLQITGEVNGQSLVEKAENKYSRSRVLEATRGTIFDRNKEVIAEDANSYTLVAILSKKATTNKEKPQHVINPEKTANKLASLIDLSEDEIYKTLTKKGAFQVEFGRAGRDLPNETIKKIKELKLPGITFRSERKRYYPNGIFSSHLIGYVERNDNGDMKGKLGIEQSLNNFLTGKDGVVNYQSDIWDYMLPDSKVRVTAAEHGKDIHLTIDKKIQLFLEDALNKVNSEYSPEKIVAIVVNPKTGEILGMAQRPTFNPDTKEGIEKSWHNQAVELSFEPGSTMKIFTLAAAIEEGVFNENEIYQSGSYKVTENSKPIHDHNKVGWGPITYLEGVQRSSNVAFAKIVKEQLGFDKFRDYITKFGFDETTGIDLPNEANGKIAYEWPIEKVTTSFGQGTAITPIQQIQAATAIANDGKMVQPYVIDKIVDTDSGKVIKDTKPMMKGSPISKDTAKKVRDILETVVSSPKGTGYKKYNINGYEVAGKTGTAQIPDPKGGYLAGNKNYVFSFLGMAPKDDPELLMYVAVQQPNIDNYANGSVPVSEIFTSVMQASLHYLNIESSEQRVEESIKVPALLNLSKNDSINKAEKLDLNPIVLGDGKTVKKQIPNENELVLKGQKILLLTEEPIKVPDMKGWSLRDVIKFAKLANLNLNTSGSGFVTKQNLTPGSKVKSEDYLIIHLDKNLTKIENSKNEEKIKD
jgi:penicillin-binding protein 2B